MTVQIASRSLPVSLMALLLVVSVLPAIVSGATQIDVGLGENRFFLGERFLITFKDVIYGVTGMLMGFLFASTFLFIADFDGIYSVMQGGKKGGSSKKKDDTDKEDGASRNARLVGSKKYPTQMEERVLTAIHTEPENYVGRQGRLIGAKRLSTGMETRMLTGLESPENEFGQQDVDLEEDDDAKTSVASRLFKILFSLATAPKENTGMTEDESALPKDNYF